MGYESFDNITALLGVSYINPKTELLRGIL